MKYLVLPLLLLFALSAQAQKIIYVDVDATIGANNGTSWKDAYTDLESAIGAAFPDDSIWVAGGEYLPSGAAFHIKKNVKLFGGFAGTEANFDHRNLAAPPVSVLKGAGNSYVIYLDGLMPSSVLDGFTITGGNTASNDGGGIFNDGSPVIMNCTFTGNKTSGKGGGIYNYNCSPVIMNCTFTENTAGSLGGGICNNGSSPVITNCTFSGNTAGSGGGIYNRLSSSPVITNCTFGGNEATHAGSGIFNAGSSPVITNCTFGGNKAGDKGGGIFNNASSPVIANCIIYGNTADGEESGIFSDASSSPKITYSLVQGMSADEANHNLDGNTDPQFANVSDGDFHLGLSSPVIDKGHNDSLPPDIRTDLEGNPRIYNQDGGGMVDLGAYESSYDRPVLAIGAGAAAYTENDGPLIIADGVITTLSDLDDPTLVSGWVRIGGDYQAGEDTLVFDNNNTTSFGNIAASSFDDVNGLLTLTSDGGTATLAQWQNALQAVTYSNPSDSPNTGDRSIKFIVADGGGSNSDTVSKTITITAVNDVPALTAGSGSPTVTEGDNEPSDSVVIDGGITVSDADNTTLDSATVSITGNFKSSEDTLLFKKDASTMGDITAAYDKATGVLRLGSIMGASVAEWQAALRAVAYGNNSENPDENDRTVSFRIKDGTVYSTAVTKTVTVKAVNDAPVITSNGSGATASISIAENETAVTTVTSTDADAGTLTYSLAGGTDQAKFSIDASTGALTFITAPNFESSADDDGNNEYEVTVRVSDGVTTDGQAITVTVTDAGDAPAITSNGGGTTAGMDVTENTTAVRTVTATDEDAGTTFTYSLSGGADSDKFNIDASTGALTFNTTPDYENPGDEDKTNTYEVSVQVSDGTKTDEQAITVSVTDANDITPVISASQGFAVDERSAVGTTTGTVLATDGDVISTTYQDWTIVSGNTNDAFKIDPATGVITVNNGPALDYEAKSLYTLALTVSDGLHTSAPQTVTIRLNNRQEAPTAVSLIPVTIYENQPAGTPAGRLSSAAQDAGATFTYILAAGEGDADNSLFTVSGDALKTKAILNYEQKNRYSIRVRVTTQYGKSLEKAFTINIKDVNEAPTLDAITDQAICYTPAPQEISLNGLSAGEDAGQTTIPAVNSDDDALFESLAVSDGKLQYSIKDGAAGSATVTVTVTDDGGTANGGINTVSRSFTLTVNPLPKVTITSDIGTQLSKGTMAHLAATGGTTYQWTAAEGIMGGLAGAMLTVRPAQDATYHVTATNAEGCNAGGAIALTVKDDYTALSANNIFTPNGDGKNDAWTIVNLDLYPDNEVSVYDRSGRLVFHKKNYQNDWRGMLNGRPLITGTYYYVVTLDSGRKVFKGFITIFRDE